MSLNILIRKYAGLELGARPTEAVLADLGKPGGLVHRATTRRYRKIYDRAQVLAEHYRRAEPIKHPDIRLESVMPLSTFVDQHVGTNGEATQHGEWQKFVKDKPETRPWKR